MTFCLADGSLLSAPYDPNATLLLQALPGEVSSSHPPKQKKPDSIAKYVVVTFIALLMGGGIVFLFTRLKTGSPNQPSSSSKSSESSPQRPAASPTIASALPPNTAKYGTEPTPTPSQVTEESKAIEGTYYLYEIGNLKAGVMGTMTISNKDTGIIVRGKDWQGEGSVNGTQGFYNWRFEDGKTGRTEITINSDGTIKGHVVGSGINWWYLARRAKSK
jgi:hypothetical protein